MKHTWRIGCVAFVLGSACVVDDQPSDPSKRGMSGQDGEVEARAAKRRARAQPSRDEHCIALPALASDASSSSARCEAAAAPGAFGSRRPVGVGDPSHEGVIPDEVAYLTFDDGPSELTGSLLDTLAMLDVRATFFVRGRSWGRQGMGLEGSYRDAHGNSISYADVLKRIVEEGHALGNGTLDHLDLGALTPAEVAEQLDENERVINLALFDAGVGPRPLTLLRPPFGSPWFHGPIELEDRARHQQEVGAELEQRGVAVLWNVDSTDSREWAQGETPSHAPIELGGEPSDVTYAEKVARIEEAVLDAEPVRAGRGAIVLLNDMHNTTRDVLGRIIEGLRARGYAFATLEELVHAQFDRPSWAVTPGPDLQAPCIPAEDRGCLRFEAAGIEVCGRFFRAYEAAGGADVLGQPVGNAVADSGGAHAWSQRFVHGVLELRPDVEPPCNVIFRDLPQ